MCLHGLLSLLLGLAGGSETVTWVEVEEAIKESVCLADNPHRPGDFYVPFADRAACGLQPASTAVERAVETTFRRSFPLLVPAPVPMFSEELQAAKSKAEPDAPKRC